ncbi:MAG TPA: VCBS repeat-containing protein, partial [Armatimonadota bacterium]|nr:VCBS repeat-containing protein [Armatimonadota bacterium]
MLRAILLAACLLALAPLPGCRRSAPPADPAPVLANLPDYRNIAAESGLRFSWKQPGVKVWTNRQGFGCGCAFVDYDRDGWQDIFLVGQPKCALFRNNRDGTFTDVTARAGITRAGHWNGVATGDYDNDGYPDLYVSGFADAMLLHNDAGRRFTDRARAAGLAEKEWGTSCAFLDYDADGRLDLLVGHYVVTGGSYPKYCQGKRGVLTGCPPMVYPPQFPKLFHNVGNGRFVDVTQACGLGMAHGKALALQVADYDNDGRVDVYIANDGEPGDLLHNLGGRFENVSMQTGTAFGMSGEA